MWWSWIRTLEWKKGHLSTPLYIKTLTNLAQDYRWEKSVREGKIAFIFSSLGGPQGSLSLQLTYFSLEEFLEKWWGKRWMKLGTKSENSLLPLFGNSGAPLPGDLGSRPNYILWIYNYGVPQACGTRFRESLHAEY